MRDFAIAFCDACETNLGVMVDQQGRAAIVCACPDGTYDLGDDAQAWVDDRATRMST